MKGLFKYTLVYHICKKKKKRVCKKKKKFAQLLDRTHSKTNKIMK